MEDAKIYAYNNEITAGAMVLARGCKKVDGRRVRGKFNRVQKHFANDWAIYAQVVILDTGFILTSWNTGVNYTDRNNVRAVFTFARDAIKRVVITLITK